MLNGEYQRQHWLHRFQGAAGAVYLSEAGRRHQLRTVPQYAGLFGSSHRSSERSQPYGLAAGGGLRVR